jgi:hypothetical protein
MGNSNFQFGRLEFGFRYPDFELILSPKRQKRQGFSGFNGAAGRMIAVGISFLLSTVQSYSLK